MLVTLEMILQSLPVLQKSLSSLSLSSQELDKETLFENILAIYCRNSDFQLINSTVYSANVDVLSALTLVKQRSGRLEQFQDYEGLENIYGGGKFMVIEKSHGDQVVGLIIKSFNVTELDEWIIKLILNTSKVVFKLEENVSSNNALLQPFKSYTSLIVDAFADILKNTTNQDQWEEGGKLYFEKKVDFFTSKGLTIECVLPAFPCKSSNLKKVATTKPDLGEELALRKLCDFSKAVKQIYPPGIIVWIVSDGHVFSDCIGVNDYDVNIYGAQLKDVYQRVKQDEAYKNEGELIKFASLVDMFNLKENPIATEMIQDINVPHHIDTTIDKESEICRKLLIYSCDTDSGQLKLDIKTPNHPRLSLYRGFSKFMEEDLYEYFQKQGVTRKAMKKKISKVAFEMIKRNDAYSNLVELMFPLHLRLSIHAHTNSGPKYGIKLLSTDTIKVVKSLQECEEPDYDDLLHIPTPWHNSILKYEGEEKYFITRASVILEAFDLGTHKGYYNENVGCFYISRNM